MLAAHTADTHSLWQFRPILILFLVALAACYVVGWSRLRRRSRHGRLATRWRPVAYVSGLAILALALMSPIDAYAERLFLVHMVQHVLLVMVVPPLLLVANPLPFLLWGVPSGARPAAGALLAREAPLRRALRRATTPGIVWLLFVALYWGWHDPQMYDLALRNELVHDLEHASFFGAAMLLWWHVTGAGPRIHGRFSRAARAAYAATFIPPNMVAGIVLAFANAPLYATYVAAERLWGLSALQDQRWGGLIMWVPGSMMFIIAALFLLYRQFDSDPVRERATPAPARP